VKILKPRVTGLQGTIQSTESKDKKLAELELFASIGSLVSEEIQAREL
jgi:hypothetical protein